MTQTWELPETTWLVQKGPSGKDAPYAWTHWKFQERYENYMKVSNVNIRNKTNNIRDKKNPFDELINRLYKVEKRIK